MKIPRIAAFLVALLHLMFVGAIAIRVLIALGEPPSTEAWLLVAWLDLPVHYLSFLFVWLIPHLPHISALSGVAGDWEAFLFPLIWFGVLGTAQWSIIGWTIGKAYVQVVNHRAARKTDAR